MVLRRGDGLLSFGIDSIEAQFDLDPLETGFFEPRSYILDSLRVIVSGRQHVERAQDLHFFEFLVGVIKFRDRKSTRLNSSHLVISYAVFCLKKKKKTIRSSTLRDQNNPLIKPTSPVKSSSGRHTNNTPPKSQPSTPTLCTHSTRAYMQTAQSTLI